MKTIKIQISLVAALAATLSAQRITDSRTASMRGGGGDGKCTVEVDVDGVAEVEILGIRAQIRTVSGGAANIRRFECNQELPGNPNDFRFKGIDGRGRQTLVRQPGGRGPAVIRIEDSKGGREGYTFDIFWRGSSGFGNGGNNNDYGNGNGNGGFGNNNGGGWNNNGGNNEVNFSGRGDGSLRSDRNGDNRLYNCRVSIDRRGNVDVSFDTDRNRRIAFSGRVERMDRDRIIADMNGNNLGGLMEIEVDNRNRVRSVFMAQRNGRDRYELNWRN